MQAQLEQLEADYGIEWQDYRLGDLFEIGRGTISNQQSLIPDPKGIIFVTQNDSSNGFVNRVQQEHHRTFAGNSLMIGRQTGVVYYQEQEFLTTDGVLVLNALNGSIKNTAVGLFFTSSLSKKLSASLFGYSNTVSASKLNELTLQLPTIRQDGEPQIAFDFMEAFIATLKAERLATLKAERLATLKAYLTVTGLSNTTLTPAEQSALDGLDSLAWKSFRVGDLFKKLNLKNHNNSFDKVLDTSTTRTDEFNLPLVNAKLGNNGIMFYGRDTDFDSATMTIDVISNGAVATGTVYAQPHKAGVLWDAYLLKVNNQEMNPQKLLYLTACLQKSIKTKFGWEDKAVWSKVQHEIMSLPITAEGTPDYEMMSLVVSALQKVVIQDVVAYLDRRIDATSEIA